MKEMSANLNLDEEIAAMAEFISLRWEPLPDLLEMFREIRDAALHDARGWIDQYMVSSCTHDLLQEREALLEPVSKRAVSYDAVCQFLSNVCLRIGRVKDAGMALDGPWDFSRRSDKVYYAMAKKYPALVNARPLGWDELAKGYRDFAGQAEYDPTDDIRLFKGVNSDSAGASGFHGRTVLPYVMYDEKCQGRKAPRVLVSSAYAHFLFIAEQLHGYQVCDELRQIGNLKVPEMVFEVSWPEGSAESAFLKALKGLADAPPTQAEYEEALAAEAAFNALPEEEKAARIAANKARMAEMMKNLFSNKPDPEAEAREAARNEKLNAVMREAFGQ